MYKHVVTALTATVTGLTLTAAPAAAEPAAPLPCVQGSLAASDSVLDVISADELLWGLFGSVDEDWTSPASLPDEDDVDAFAQGLLADVFADPFLAPYETRAVDDDLLRGVAGATAVVCVTPSGAHAVSTWPYGAAAVRTWPYGPAAGRTYPYGPAADPAWPHRAPAVRTWPYGTSAVSTSDRSGSLLGSLGVTGVVDTVVGGLRP